jgi:hypothetical protein
MKNCRLLFIILPLFLPLPALAWDSAVHTALTQLTRTIVNVPGFWDSPHEIVLADQAGEQCNKKTRKKNLSQAPQSCVFVELVCGADDPDSEKHWWNPKENHDHQTKAEQFAVDEFNAAVKAHGEYGTKGHLAYAEAANHLGRSMHFIQDLTDFSKDMSSRSAAKKIRKKAIERAQDYLSEWNRTRKYPSRLMTRLESMRAELATEPPPQTPAELVRDAFQQRKEMADIIMEFLNDPAEGSHDSKLDEAVVLALAGTIVIQEYWVDLYLKQIGVKR